MRLIGRDRELAEIARLVERGRRGHGGLLVVVGATGSGKTAIADAAADAARGAGVQVLRPAPNALLSQVFDDAPNGTDNGAPGALRPRLLVIDDIDRAGDEAMSFLIAAAERIAGSTTTIVATSTESLGLGPECFLPPLSEEQLALVLDLDLDAEIVGAIHLASRGAPGRAVALAETLQNAGDIDPVAYLALNADSVAEFLDVDPTLVQLLEMARARRLADATRARVAGRLARELIGDPTAADRRSVLADEAEAAARAAGDDSALADALDARIHAIWGPGSAERRLAVAEEMIQLARAARDSTIERRGLFWRFATLMELRLVDAAEVALAEYARSGAAEGDAEVAAVAAARHSMLAAMRGRFDEARTLATEFADQARPAGIADADRLFQSLLAMIGIEQGVDPDGSSADLRGYARRQPGHHFGATAAFILVLEGRVLEADAELERCLPEALGASGPRTLKAMAELALVAAATGNDRAAAILFDAMFPYRHLLVIAGGANLAMGPVSRYLGILALRRGTIDDAVDLLTDAVAFEESVGALPGLANTLAVLARAYRARDASGDAQRAAELGERSQSLVHRLGMRSLLVDRWIAAVDEWSLLATDGGDWALDAGEEHVRLRDGRGVHYLRALLAAPGQEIAALDLVAGGAGLLASRDEPRLDGAALQNYRRRLEELETEMDAADRAGDVERAVRAQSEHDTVLAELRRVSGLGGRVRGASNESERARVNATRTLRATVERIAAGAPRAGAHLEASLRTGRACRYDAAPGGPSRWRL